MLNKSLALRIFLVSSVLGFGVMSTPTLATDQRCFTKAQCDAVRSDMGGVSDGFYIGDDAKKFCGTMLSPDGSTEEQLGFCLPAGQATTNITFGGKQTFANFGEFIKYGYQYGMWVAGIIAVTLIVISGFQWAASGGSSDAIGAAKTRIEGAITGLVLLAFSYVILNTINPYLVELRLPQTWMINPIAVTPPFCSSVVGKKLAYLAPSGNIDSAVREKQLAAANSKGYNIDPQSTILPGGDKGPEVTPTCGHDYLVQGAGTLSCAGSICAPNGDEAKSCLPFDVKNAEGINTSKEVTNNSSCWRGNLVIRYQVGGMFEGLINTATKNLAGGVEQSDDDSWLEDKNLTSNQNKQIGFAFVCKNPENELTLGLINHTPNLVPFTHIINPVGYDTYIIRYTSDSGGSLSKILEPYLEADNQKSACTGLQNFTNNSAFSQFTPVGIFIVNEINLNYDSYDRNLYIGKSPTAGVAGGYVYDNDVREKFLEPDWIKNYIPLTDIGFKEVTQDSSFIPGKKVTNLMLDNSKALFLDFTLTSDMIAQLKNSK